MKSRLFLFSLGCIRVVSLAAAAELQELASFPATQVTGVGVSKTGRVFVNFPDWGDEHPMSVAEVIDGRPKPFPDAEWNTKGDVASTFICVQSVVVDGGDQLWVVDPAAPKMQSIVKGGPKLVKVDLKTDMVVQKIPFGEDVAVFKSYLNDVRIDTTDNTAFITDSGQGAIVVVDLNTGKSRRLLDGHDSTAAEKGFQLKVEGRELINAETESRPRIHSDGIALDAANGYLYYHALTGSTLYRIKTEHLKNDKLSARDLEANVEMMGKTPPPDGMLEAEDGTVYLTDIENSAILRFDPQTKQLTEVIRDSRLSWPDTLAWGPDGALYVTASQIQNMPRFNDGKNSRRTEPYRLFKVTGIR